MSALTEERFSSLTVLASRVSMTAARVLRSPTSGRTLTVMGTGSRGYRNRNRINMIMATILSTCEMAHVKLRVIAGGASGADALYIRWAREAGMDYKVFPANWETYRKGAGPKRNQEMVDSGPDFFVAVGMAPASGTEDCVKRAWLANILGWVDGPLSDILPKPVRLVGGQVVQAHHPERCADTPPCCVHNPSDHHMASWRQHWRNAGHLFSISDVMERICPHGIGHPDPDHIEYIRTALGDRAAGVEGVHGCDGCCRTREEVTDA